MADELNKNQSDKRPQAPLDLDPGQNEGDLMLPEPSPEQDILWNRLDDVVGEAELTREIPWVRTPAEIREYLASEDVSKRIRRIGEKYKLSSMQVPELARLVRYVFIKEIDFKNVIVAVFENLKTDRETAKKIGEDVKLELFVPKRDYLLTLFGAETKETARPIAATAVSTPPVPLQASLPPREKPIDPSLMKEKSVPVPPAAPRPLEPEKKNLATSSVSALPSREQPSSPRTKSWEDRFTSVMEPLDASRGSNPVSKVKPAPMLQKVSDTTPASPKNMFTVDSVNPVRSSPPKPFWRISASETSNGMNKKAPEVPGKIIPETPRPSTPATPQPSSPAPESTHFRSVPQYGLASTLKNLRDAEEPNAPREPGKQVSPPSPPSGGGVQLDDLYNKVKSQGAPPNAVPPPAPSPSHVSSSRDMGNFMRTMKGDLEATKSPSRISNS